METPVKGISYRALTGDTFNIKVSPLAASKVRLGPWSRQLLILNQKIFPKLSVFDL
jgi:hypothetical protein